MTKSYPLYSFMPLLNSFSIRAQKYKRSICLFALLSGHCQISLQPSFVFFFTCHLADSHIVKSKRMFISALIRSETQSLISIFLSQTNSCAPVTTRPPLLTSRCLFALKILGITFTFPSRMSLYTLARTTHHFLALQLRVGPCSFTASKLNIFWSFIVPHLSGTLLILSKILSICLVSSCTIVFFFLNREGMLQILIGS
jgi:hypothetical protein